MEEIRRLQDAVREDPTADNLRALATEEMSFLDEQARNLKDAKIRGDRARARCEALRKEIDEISGSLNNRGDVLSEAECEAFRQKYMDLMREFATRKEVLTYILAYSAADFKLADLSVVSGWLDSWTTFFTSADGAVRELRHTERRAVNSNTLPATAVLSSALDDVCKLQLQARTVVGRERYRRSASSEESVSDFMDSQEQLKDWCEKQLATLRGLQSVEDLTEFGSSFYANVPVMDSNFLVLTEQSEALMDNKRVRDALRDVNRSWIQLCLETYERLQAAVGEAHASSSLEQQCSGWQQEVAPQLQQVLEQAKAYLADAGDEGEGKKLRIACNKLLKQHEAHGIVCTHLADYGIRQDCVKPHVDSLKRELQSALASTVLTFPNYEPYEGKQEYRHRMEELQEWIDVKAQKGTYMKLLERLETTKQMIEEHADILFPDEK